MHFPTAHIDQEFFEFAKQAGLARILQGVHFPSDNKASVIVAKKLYPLIKERLEHERESKKIPTNGCAKK